MAGDLARAGVTKVRARRPLFPLGRPRTDAASCSRWIFCFGGRQEQFFICEQHLQWPFVLGLVGSGQFIKRTAITRNKWVAEYKERFQLVDVVECLFILGIC